MKSTALALGFVLTLLHADRSFCQSPQPEPNSPTILETVKYIQAYTSDDIQLDGTTLTMNHGPYDYEVNLLNVHAEQFKYDTSLVSLSCPGDANCIPYSNCPKPICKYHARNVEIHPTDAIIAPRVLNAVTHLIRLVQQDAHPKDNDPFAR